MARPPFQLGQWAHVRSFTISNTNVDSNQTHFGMLLTLGASVGTGNDDVRDIFTEVGANSQKIAVTDDAGVELFCEVQQWDESAMTAVLWVSRSDWVISSSAPTVVYLWYDNGQPNNTSFVGLNASAVGQNVWDGDYELVMHLIEDASAGAGAFKDSTSNGRDGTAQGTPTQTAGQIGTGQLFAGGTDSIRVPSYFGVLGEASRSTQMWVKTTQLAGSLVTYGQVVGAAGRRWQWRINALSGAEMQLRVGDLPAGDTLGTTALDDDVFHSTALTLIDDGSPLCSEVIGYVDGVNDSMALVAGDMVIDTISSSEVRIGEGINGGGHLDGVVDEVRISSIARSAAWLKAEDFAQRDDIGAWGDAEHFPSSLFSLAGTPF